MYALLNAMQFTEPSEDFEHFKARVRAIESGRKTSDIYLYIAIPTGTVSIILLIYSLVGRLSCIFNILGIVMLVVTVASIYYWFQTKRAEEFVDERRRERIIELNGSAKCVYLEGYVPDGSSRIGRCILYKFTLTEYPYCIYCSEYRKMDDKS
jgi:Ca2+/Na+ antiporter